MAQGGRQDGRRHRVAARLLRLPGRALDPPQDDEPDRVHVLDGQAAHEGHQGPRLTSRRPGDGVQADRVRRTTLAGSQRTAPRRPRPRRSTLREGEDRRTRTARSGRRRVINEESDPQVLTIPHGIRSTLSMPLRAGQRPLGAMNLYSHEINGFTADDQIAPGRFAAQASIVLANAQLYAQSVTLNTHLPEAMRTREIISQAQGII